jgi:hypothetical protein
MQPITATFIAFHARIGLLPFRHLLAQEGLDVVGQFLEHGRGGAAAARAGDHHRGELAQAHGLQDLLADHDFAVRSPPGSGVSEMRMVSPMPSCSSTDRAAVEATMPLLPMPASVRPRCSG